MIPTALKGESVEIVRQTDRETDYTEMKKKFDRKGAKRCDIVQIACMHASKHARTHTSLSHHHVLKWSTSN